MRRLIAVLVLVAALAAAYRTLDPTNSGIGMIALGLPSPAPEESAPQFTHDRLNGDSFELTDQGTYVVTFLNTLNANSIETRSAFAQLAREFSDSPVRFAAIYIGGLPKDAQAAPHAVLHDRGGELSGLYRIKTVPRTFVVSDGEIYSVGEEAESTEAKISRESLQRLLIPIC